MPIWIPNFGLIRDYLFYVAKKLKCRGRSSRKQRHVHTPIPVTRVSNRYADAASPGPPTARVGYQPAHAVGGSLSSTQLKHTQLPANYKAHCTTLISLQHKSRPLSWLEYIRTRTNVSCELEKGPLTWLCFVCTHPQCRRDPPPIGGGGRPACTVGRGLFH